MNEAQEMILGVLQKAYNDAIKRITMVGMQNTYGLTPVERREQSQAYQALLADADQALRALDAYKAPLRP